MAPYTHRYFNLSTAVVLAALAIACGSNNGGSPTSPSPSSIPTVTLTASGASPSVTHVSAGQQVRFVNNDGQNHQINSDPFPGHGDCPAINDVGMLAAGQSKMTGTFPASKSCAFHDHLNHDAKSFQGQILVDTNQPAPGYSTAGTGQ
jgi:plastocyanin